MAISPIFPDTHTDIKTISGEVFSRPTLVFATTSFYYVFDLIDQPLILLDIEQTFLQLIVSSVRQHVRTLCMYLYT